MGDFQNDEQLYKNLVLLLKEFKNRPWHLAKYLIEKNALSDDFINEVLSSNRLNKMDEMETKALVKAVYFIDISHMNDYLNSLTDEVDYKKKNLSSLNPDELRDFWNQKLDQYLREERYEDAIRVRDYMVKHNIKRNSQ